LVLCSAAWTADLGGNIYDGKFYRVLGKSNFIACKHRVTLNMKSMKEHIFTHRHHLNPKKKTEAPKMAGGYKQNFNAEEGYQRYYIYILINEHIC